MNGLSDHERVAMNVIDPRMSIVRMGFEEAAKGMHNILIDIKAISFVGDDIEQKQFLVRPG
jgi:hypothetical protein